MSISVVVLAMFRVYIGELEEASAHKSAKNHAGNVFFVTRDFDV